MSDSFLSLLNDLHESNEPLSEFQGKISKELKQIYLNMEMMNTIELDEEIQTELNTIAEESIPTSSRKQMHSTINWFVSFLKEKKLRENIFFFTNENFEQLPEILLQTIKK